MSFIPARSLPMLAACALGLTLALAPAIALAECTEGGVCVDGHAKVAWADGESLSDKARKKNAKKYRKKKDVSLAVTLDGGRGSLFVDGVWIGIAPFETISVKPGQHDVQIRDGDTVIAQGVITVPTKASSLTIKVSHPDAGGAS